MIWQLELCLCQSHWGRLNLNVDIMINPIYQNLMEQLQQDHTCTCNINLLNNLLLNIIWVCFFYKFSLHIYIQVWWYRLLIYTTHLKYKIVQNYFSASSCFLKFYTNKGFICILINWPKISWLHEPVRTLYEYYFFLLFVCLLVL